MALPGLPYCRLERGTRRTGVTPALRRLRFPPVPLCIVAPLCVAMVLCALPRLPALRRVPLCCLPSLVPLYARCTCEC